MKNMTDIQYNKNLLIVVAVEEYSYMNLNFYLPKI